METCDTINTIKIDFLTNHDVNSIPTMLHCESYLVRFQPGNVVRLFVKYCVGQICKHVRLLGYYVQMMHQNERGYVYGDHIVCYEYGSNVLDIASMDYFIYVKCETSEMVAELAETLYTGNIRNIPMYLSCDAHVFEHTSDNGTVCKHYYKDLTHTN